MIEIIKRKEGFKSQKEQLNGSRVQVSYNSWGHLVVRVIIDDTEDSLVVFDKKASQEVINFSQRFITKTDRPLPF